MNITPDIAEIFRRNTLMVIESSIRGMDEAKILNNFLKVKPYMSKSEALLFFGSDVYKWMREGSVRFKKQGGNRKVLINTSDLVKMRCYEKIDEYSRLGI